MVLCGMVLGILFFVLFLGGGVLDGEWDFVGSAGT